MVQQDILLADGAEDLGAGARVAQQRRRGWVERRVLQIGPVDLRQRHQVGQAERTLDLVEIVGRDLQVRQQQIANALRHIVLDRQAHHRAKAALAHALLDRAQQVGGLLLLDLHIGVARDPEDVGFDHLHAGEQRIHIFGDHLFEPDEAVPALGRDLLGPIAHARRRAGSGAAARPEP